jgi:3-polyprenyl-4-hydroxybenzoate decarboxylase
MPCHSSQLKRQKWQERKERLKQQKQKQAQAQQKHQQAQTGTYPAACSYCSASYFVLPVTPWQR